MAQIIPKITIRSVYFGMLLLSAVVMILTVRLTVASDLDSLETAAEQGDVEAQFDLGYMYSSGEGVPQNDAAAAQWFSRATEQGNAEAQGNETAKENLEFITKNMSTADIAKAQELSLEYWKIFGLWLYQASSE